MAIALSTSTKPHADISILVYQLRQVLGLKQAQFASSNAQSLEE